MASFPVSNFSLFTVYKTGQMEGLVHFHYMNYIIVENVRTKNRSTKKTVPSVGRERETLPLGGHSHQMKCTRPFPSIAIDKAVFILRSIQATKMQYQAAYRGDVSWRMAQHKASYAGVLLVKSQFPLKHDHQFCSYFHSK